MPSPDIFADYMNRLASHRPRARGLLPIVAAWLAFAGCYDQAPVPGNEASDRVEVTNDEQELEQRVTYPETDVPIDGAAQPSAMLDGPARALGPDGGPALAPSSITLTLKAEADPPVVNGTTVQATSVWQASGNRAIVSYGVVGSTALGGIDLFQVTGGGTPRLRSSATFGDTDILAVSMDDNYVYAAQASSNDTLAAPAVIERLLLEGNKLTLAGSVQLPLSSFATTSVASNGLRLYATTGDAGAVFGVDPSTMAVLGQYALDDARWVAFDQPNGRIVVAQGQPGRISVFTEGAFPCSSLVLENSWPFPGADVAQSKTTVEVHGGKAFVAAGPEGVQIVCLSNGQVIGSVPRPDPASLGLDPSVVVTNAVTVQDDLMFISNGEAGVYAAAADDSFESDDCNAPTISVLGRLRFDDLQSANHVAYLGDQLYVAAGLGGIKIVEVSVR